MVINQTLAGIVEEAMQHSEIKRLLGARHGANGIFQDDYLDLFTVTKEKLDRVAATPGAGLGSARRKLDEDDCGRVFGQLKKHDVRYFFYIGGDDSALGAHSINSMARNEDYELRVFHVPKTIDNDLAENDHTPGYGSAARYVACAVLGDALDMRSIPGVKVDVIMGRDAGWLTAASILARRNEADGPHLVYLPEVPFAIEQFQQDVKSAYDQCGRCVVAVSEGIRDADGRLWAKTVGEQLHDALKDGQKGIFVNAKKDAFGHFQLSGTGILADYLTARIEEVMGGVRVRGDTFGYPQRSFPGIASPADAQEAREVGRAAVRYATAGDVDGSVTIRRAPGPKYAIYTDLAKLKDVAGKNRRVPEEYISPEGNNILDSFRDYCQPLVGDLPETVVLD